MRLKFTTLLAALLLVALAVPQTVEGQAVVGGFSVSLNKQQADARDYVIMGGNNQKIGNISVTYGPNPDATTLRRFTNTDQTLTLKFPDLEFAYEPTLHIGTDASAFDSDNATASVKEIDEDATVTGGTEGLFQWQYSAGQVMIFIPGDVLAATFGPATIIRLSDIRLDVSALEVDDKVMVSVTSSTDPGAVDLSTPVGGGDAVGPVSVATVKKGVVFKAGTGTPGLSCASAPPMSTVTVEEGFVGAWSDMLDGTGIQFRFTLTGVPDGAEDKVEWAAANPQGDVTPGDGADNKVDIGTVGVVAPKGVKDGSVVILTYTPKFPMPAPEAPDTEDADEMTARENKNDAAKGIKRSFKVTATAKFGSAANVGLWVELWPEADTNNAGNKSDLDDVLSFTSTPYAPPNADDDSDRDPGTEWLVTTECLTYLLYPWVVCGVSGWDTGISVSNTSPDPDNVVFGEFDDLKGQSGSVTAYAFPMNGNGAPPLSSMLVPNLPAGNSHSFLCSTNGVLAGFQGYVIIKAGFQQARGTAFLLGMYKDGASIDVSQGYVAEVIGDGDPTARADSQ